MLEDTATTEENQSTEEVEIEETPAPTHPYDMPGEWFVLNAQSGHEKKVKTNILTRIKNLHLEDKVYDVVIPTDEVVEIRNGKKVNLEKKTFPGYVLVRMDLDDTTWYEIRNTPSIIGFVGSGKRPIALSRREIERILGSNEVEEVKKESTKFKPDFEVGETVRVTTGPFADFKNPYKTAEAAVRSGSDTSKGGYVNIAANGTDKLDVKTCFTVDGECGTASNVMTKTITIE